MSDQALEPVSGDEYDANAADIAEITDRAVNDGYQVTDNGDGTYTVAKTFESGDDFWHWAQSNTAVPLSYMGTAHLRDWLRSKIPVGHGSAGCNWEISLAGLDSDHGRTSVKLARYLLVTAKPDRAGIPLEPAAAAFRALRGMTGVRQLSASHEGESGSVAAIVPRVSTWLA